MKTIFKPTRLIMILLVSLVFSNYSGAQAQDDYKKEVMELRNELTKIASENENIAKNLGTFDELDYVVFTNQEWTRFHESHSEDILVHWPDGSTTKGLERHIEDLKKLFVYAPDTRIEEHPIKIGSGNITAVMGYMEGTFTEPMPIGGEKFIQPNGKSFRLPMVTIGLWNERGVMYEEYLFWDNQTYLKQLGLAE